MFPRGGCAGFSGFVGDHSGATVVESGDVLLGLGLRLHVAANRGDTPRSWCTDPSVPGTDPSVFVFEGQTSRPRAKGHAS